MFNLNDQVALVTGASGGIGGAIVRGLHAQGAYVVLSGTRQAALDGLAQELGDRVHVHACRLDDASAMQDMISTIEKDQGQLDILVNNAGLTRDMLTMRLKDKDWQTVLDVNLTAAFRLSRAALKGMMKRRFGRIINITSIVGVTGNAGQANYAASKAGMIGMSKSMAQEVAARGITINCVAPGFIETAMTDDLPQSLRDTLLTNIPSGRLGQADDVASAVIFLASGEAAYVTGQTLHVNGGMAMF